MPFNKQNNADTPAKHTFLDIKMPLNVAALENYYGEILTQHQQILDLSNYEMICHLQQQFNHQENTTAFNDKEALDKNFKLLESENKEMRVVGLEPRSLKMLRDAIGDQITVALFLAFKVDGITFEPFAHISPLIPQSYADYCDQVDNALADLKEALFTTSSEDLAQDRLNHYLACLHTLPEFSQIDIAADLTDITLASLSKICPSQEVADETLAAYLSGGYKAHIEKVPSGFGIFVSEDCLIKGEVRPKGKFLKSLYQKEAQLADIEENSVWQ